MVVVAVTAIFAGLLAIYLTPLIRRGAIRFQVLDTPDGALKSQQEAVPYLGGVAVYLAFLLSLAAGFDFSREVLGLLLSSTIVMTLGLFDDLRVLPPYLKFIGQILAALVLIKADIRLNIVYLPEWASIALSIFWIVAVINAINIIDISDGLSTSTSAVAAGFLCAISLINGNYAIAVMAAALTGALLGFFPFNRQPASIYLGDTGSMFIGLTLGALSLIGKYAPSHHVSLLAPLAILYVPLFDTGFVVLCRLAKRRSIFRGSKDHFAVRLRHRGWSAKAIARLATGVSLITGAAGVGSMFVAQRVAIAIYAVLTIATILAIVLFVRLAPAPED